MPTLTELRARKGIRPRSTERITLIEGQRLYFDLAELRVERASLGTAAPAKMAGGSKARAKELDEEIEAKVDELRTYQGEVTLEGMTGGEWQRWKDAHPAREDNSDDEEHTGGCCNVSALIDALGEFVAEWDGERLQEGDWATLSEQVIYHSLRNLASAVVVLHEVEVPALAPKAPASSSTPSDESA